MFEDDAYGNFAGVDLTSLATVIPYDDYVGANKSVIDYLSDIPPSEIKTKQSRIASVVQRFHWAFPDAKRQKLPTSQLSSDAFGHIIRHLAKLKADSLS